MSIIAVKQGSTILHYDKLQQFIKRIPTEINISDR